jgi:ribosomal protein L40E
MQFEMRKSKFYPMLMDIPATLEALERYLRHEDFEVVPTFELHSGSLTASKDAVWRTALGLSLEFHVLMEHENGGTTVRIATHALMKRLISGGVGRWIMGPAGFLPAGAGFLIEQNWLSKIWSMIDKQAAGTAVIPQPPAVTPLNDVIACLKSDCQASVPVDANFCVRCGTTLRCPRCDAPRVDDATRFCHKCRFDYSTVESPDASV